MNDRDKAETTYDIIKKWADFNGNVQAISGITGLGVNLAVDALAIVWYRDMWSEIRGVYGKGHITKDTVYTFIRTNLEYIAKDIFFDKLVGTIPLLGIPFNYAYGKALTWRLGVLFGITAAAAEHPSPETMSQIIDLVRMLFPSKDIYVRKVLSFSFKEPDRDRFLRLLEAASDRTDNQLMRSAEDALAAWEKSRLRE